MTKKRTGEPWMPAAEYGRSLSAFTINLIVEDVDRAVVFYRDGMGATAHYSDPDFAALRIGDLEFMLHADHTYEDSPWRADLVAGQRRGLGAELRLFGVDPDKIEASVRNSGGTVVAAAVDKAHGWREVIIADADGYVWAVGRPTEG